MGSYLMYKVRHNLDVSSVGALAEDLRRKLGCNVQVRVDAMVDEVSQLLGMPCAVYSGTEGFNTLTIEDDYLLARAFIDRYGDRATEEVAKYPAINFVINDIDDVKSGLCSYTVCSERMERYGELGLWSITNDNISGVPGFGNDCAPLLISELDLSCKEDKDLMLELEGWRKHLLGCLSPILSDALVYYHSNYGVVSGICDVHYFGDVPKFIDNIGFKVYDMMEYILNESGTVDYYGGDYVIRDNLVARLGMVE